MYESIKRAVCDANKELFKSGLDPYLCGGISFADRRHGLVIVRSDLPYDKLTYEKIIILSLFDGSVIEGDFPCPNDILYHLSVYKTFENIGSVAHISSPNTVSWAQAKRAIPVYGNLHKLYFDYPVFCIESGADDFGTDIKLRFEAESIGASVTSALLSGDSGFAFGDTVSSALYNAEKLELIAETALKTEILTSFPDSSPAKFRAKD